MRVSAETKELLRWQQRALCARRDDPDAYFPEGKPTTALKRMCLTECQVQAECLAYALATDAIGIWGGTSTRERRTIKARDRSRWQNMGRAG